jgi:predicted NUDIX family NTP pyrophosphohydrolase
MDQRRSNQSAGIMVYRFSKGGFEVFLVHPGGPFWKNKDQHAWSIPKGEFFAAEEEALEAAKREFEEETGHKIDGKFFALSPVKRKDGKVIYAWAIEAEVNPDNLTSNTFEMEWPPKSGKIQTFPEIDQGGWFDYESALYKLHNYLKPFLLELVKRLNVPEYQLYHS